MKNMQRTIFQVESSARTFPMRIFSKDRGVWGKFPKRKYFTWEELSMLEFSTREGIFHRGDLDFQEFFEKQSEIT
jgi:hypothetical protein